MPTIHIDADACPVKEETYRVALRYAVPVVVVANSTMRIPANPLVTMVVPGFLDRLVVLVKRKYGTPGA